MKVTIIITTYNRCNLVQRALDSAIRQSADGIEILVIDDGSTDGTDKIIAEIAARAPVPIRYVWKQNGGCASARNAGLREAGGDAFIFLDSDDAFLPTAVSSLAKVMDETQADIVYSPAVEVFKNGKERVNIPVAPDRPHELAQAYFLDSNIRNGAILFRRGVLDRTGFLDESLRYNEDADFLMRVVINSKAAYSPSPSVKVYQHAQNKSSNKVAIYKSWIKSAERLLNGNPAFRAALGSKADDRLNYLRGELMIAHIVDGNYDEARTVMRAVHGHVVPFAQAAILLRSAAPIGLMRFGRRVMRKLGLLAG